MALRRRKSGLQQAVDQAVEFVGSAIDDAREAAGPMLTDAREKAAPYLAQGAAFAADQAGALRDAAAEAATAAHDRAADVAESTGIAPKPKKKHRVRKLLVLAGLGGVAAMAVKKLQGGSSDNWQSSYTPTPPAQPAAAAASEETVDPAGASPDEAIADAAESPNPVSTPDDPATVVELDPERPA